MKQSAWLIITLLSFTLFVMAGRVTPSRDVPPPPAQSDRVVISAPLQLLMYGGDRFLAADLETMRLAATALMGNDRDTASYLVRAHHLVSQLNPCHEDNYYLGNALLTWGGAVDEGNDLLRRAMECRQWDEIPPFFYGFNQYYFHRNIAEARRALELAAQRSPGNYAALQKSAIMLTAGEIDDDRMALDYLQQQRDQAADPKLRQMLDKRVVRLEGLITLRDAQQRFETQFTRPLSAPNELLAHGLLERFPTDPMRLGYEFKNGVFMLKQLRIAGMEEKR